MKSSELDGRKYRLLGEVETSQCGGDNPNSGGPNVAAAHEVLRTNAAELGADAILDVACGDGGMTARCWPSFECRGDAIAWGG